MIGNKLRIPTHGVGTFAAAKMPLASRLDNQNQMFANPDAAVAPIGGDGLARRAAAFSESTVAGLVLPVSMHVSPAEAVTIGAAALLVSAGILLWPKAKAWAHSQFDLVTQRLVWNFAKKDVDGHGVTERVFFEQMIKDGPHAKMIPELIAALNSENVKERRVAIEALGRSEDTSALRALWRASQTELDPFLKLRAAEFLTSRVPQDMKPAILIGLSSSDGLLRRVSAVALGLTDDPEWQHALWNCAFNDPSDHVRRIAAQGLQHDKISTDLLPATINYLRSENVIDREIAIIALTGTSNEAAQMALWEEIIVPNDPSLEDRSYAKRDNEALKKLAAKALKLGPKSGVRTAVIAGLKKKDDAEYSLSILHGTDDPAAQDALWEYCTQTNDLNAATALRGKPHPNLLIRIMDEIKTGNAEQQLRGIAALSMTKDVTVQIFLRDWAFRDQTTQYVRKTILDNLAHTEVFTYQSSSIISPFPNKHPFSESNER